MDEIVEAIFDWTEKHAGLAAWIAAGIAVAAIYIGWVALRLENERIKNNEINAKVDRFLEIISRFDTKLQKYIDELRGDDERFGDVIDKRAITRLIEMNVTEWPNVDSFNAFHEYWELVTKILEKTPEELKTSQRDHVRIYYWNLEYHLSKERKTTRNLIDELMK